VSSLRELIESPADWLGGTSEESELVLSCRVRFARNLDRVPFPHRARVSNMKKVLDEVKRALTESPSMSGAIAIDMDAITPNERMILLERHLVSVEMIQNYRNRSLIVQTGERLSAMINEEDHLRLQSLASGLSIREAFSCIDTLDDELDERLSYAFSENLGYLTACPTNVGTGLRVSAMVHLPGIVHSNDLPQIVKGLNNVRLTVRGMYGEGSDAMGNMFQISNSITLGLSEEETVQSLESHLRKVLEFEKKAREVLLRKARSLLEDKICRAHGILKSARLVTSKEAMDLMSAVRMGVGLGILTDVSIAQLNELLIMIKPMHLQELYGRPMSPEERDTVRADFIRSRLGVARKTPRKATDER
jgi:protein arginine kinase